MTKPVDQELERQRFEALHRVEGWLEVPMIVLGLLWLAALIVELTWGISPLIQRLTYLIWFVFLLEFALRFMLAPNKLRFVRANWLTLIALVLPALRVFRAFRLLRLARAARGVRLVRILASVNRGMASLGNAMARRGLSYVILLTGIVIAAGAAGMYAFEAGLNSYGEALWWTAMLLTTIGSEYWPVTPEGRVLSLLLSGYALGVLGYITGALASFFVGRDVAELGAGRRERDSRELQHEVAELRRAVRELTERLS